MRRNICTLVVEKFLLPPNSWETTSKILLVTQSLQAVYTVFSENSKIFSWFGFAFTQSRHSHGNHTHRNRTFSKTLVRVDKFENSALPGFVWMPKPIFYGNADFTVLKPSLLNPCNLCSREVQTRPLITTATTSGSRLATASHDQSAVFPFNSTRTNSKQ